MRNFVAGYLEYISGARRGAFAVMVRGALSALSVPYWIGSSSRSCLYRLGVLRRHRLDARVISVGNITTGGTGKTPLVVWLGEWLQQRGVSAAILSRGYGEKASAGAVESDEQLLFRRRLPGVPHLVGKSRYETGLRAIREHGTRCLVLDDGFQHLALERDLDIVLVDCLVPFGYGRLLPRGLLREPLGGLRRADLVVLTRCDLVSGDRVQELRRQVEAIRGRDGIVESAHRPTHFAHRFSDARESLDWVRARKVYAFSALGNPEAFPRTLDALGAKVVRHEAFRDHHWYGSGDLAAIARAAASAGAEAVVTTEKDAVKITAFPEDAPPLYVLSVEFAVTQGATLLADALERVVQP